MGTRQNQGRELLATVRTSPRVADVLHRDTIVAAAATLTAAHTANQEAGNWTSGLRTGMTAAAAALTALVAQIDA